MSTATSRFDLNDPVDQNRDKNNNIQHPDNKISDETIYSIRELGRLYYIWCYREEIVGVVE